MLVGKLLLLFPIPGFPLLGNITGRSTLLQALMAAAGMKKSRHSQKYRRILQLLRQLREDRGLLQSDVARKFGAYASFVSKCESGERRIDVVELADFCHVYGIPVREFLNRAEIE